MNRKQAKTLTDKFFNGDTSVREEAALYEYYSSADVAEELLPLRRMFLDFAALQAEGFVAPPQRHPRYGVTTPSLRRSETLVTARRNAATP